MDILLVNSNNHQFQSAMPLGLMRIATEINRTGRHAVEIVDLPVEADNPIDEFVDAHVGSRPLLFVGLSTMCNTFPRSLSVARSIRAKRPDLKIVLGGPQASSKAAQILERYDFIDCVVKGEAETVLGDLISALEAGVYKSRTGLLFRSDLDRAEGADSFAPLPDLDALADLDYATYPIALADPVYSIEAGRGCPYGCTFCSTKDFFRRRFRLRDPARIVDELSRIKKKCGAKRFDLVHDMFTTNRKLVVSFCDSVLARGLECTWSCSARTDRVDTELLELMYAAGCRSIFFGIETGSQRLQRDILKKLDVEDAAARALEASTLGFDVTASLIIGFPNESREDICDTINLIFRLRALRPKIQTVQVHLLSPLSGTELTTANIQSICFDGHITDMTSVKALSEWERSEIIADRDLFSSFYYFTNREIRRAAYRSMYWILFFMARFETVSKLLWEQLRDETGSALFEAVDSHPIEELDEMEHQQSSYSLPLLRGWLHQFIDSDKIAQNSRPLLHEAVEFDFWRYRAAETDDADVFLSAFDFVEIDRGSADSSTLGDGAQFAYGWSGSNSDRTISRVMVPAAVTQFAT